jgi:hypothetical protein
MRLIKRDAMNMFWGSGAGTLTQGGCETLTCLKIDGPQSRSEITDGNYLAHAWI